MTKDSGGGGGRTKPDLPVPPEDVRLPPGNTCADCGHINRCVIFGFTRVTRTVCDFAPSRFVKVTP